MHRKLRRVLRASVALALPFSFALSAAPLPAQEAAVAVVQAVHFEGLTNWSESELQTRVHTKPGEAYNPLRLREDLGSLAHVMRTVKVRTEPVDGGGVDVYFHVEEFPKLREFQVVGNEKLKSEKIEKLANLKEGDVLDGRTVESLKKAVAEEYRLHGMPNTKVDVKVSRVLPEEIQTAQAMPAGREAEKQPRQADIQIVVDEGEKVLVDDVQIKGNEAFSNIRLKSMIETKDRVLFLPRSSYNDTAFEEDLIRLRSFYASEGYFDALVERGQFEKTVRDGKTVITPVIKIHEGQRYRLGEVNVRGARFFSREELRQPFEELRNSPYDQNKFQEAVRQVQSRYFDAGFRTTQLQPIYEYDSANGLLHVTLDIEEEGVIYVGEVKVERPRYEVGEARSRFGQIYERWAPPITDEAIEREVDLEPGDIYRATDERRTVRQLEGLDIFSKVEVANVPTADPSVHDVRIYVEEGSTGRVFGGVGFGDRSGLFGYLGLNERNLFGDARDLRARIQVGTSASSFFVSYRDRYFRDTEDALTVALYYQMFRRAGYDEDVAGGYVEVARRLGDGRGVPFFGALGSGLNEDWEAAVRTRLEYVMLDERSGFNADEDLDKSYPVATVALNFFSDTNYPRKAPTEGRVMAGGVEIGYADGPLVKFTGTGEWHYPLTKKVTYHFQPTVGLIPYSSDVVGITERFFLGGSDDLRGFEYRGAGRRDSDEDEVAIGGALKLLARNEVSFPIFDPVSGVYFIDVGTLGASPIDIETPRVSTGIGARLALGNVNAAVDLALPVIYDGDDQTQFLHFRFDSFF